MAGRVTLAWSATCIAFPWPRSSCAIYVPHKSVRLYVQVLTVNVSAEIMVRAELCDAKMLKVDASAEICFTCVLNVLCNAKLNMSAESFKEIDQLICFWNFGPQCPTSPLLPPRKDPLKDFDGYRTSANTHPHKQHLYGLLDSTMHTSRNCVTNYIHKFNVIVLGRDLFVKWVLRFIH
ncbi:hypothetical protein F511_38877 [Dorcoceras hygrometricum]|uniref:Uncharacterized protein n=1 Tax=Dorcoceras hygrometricum TaxID=472368 RepID=A0A2Z7DHW5_9LAMI|nr:hypothetical protein F511_38877 [Dorcoceras hygrometricum]